jgi:hypothetical protein
MGYRDTPLTVEQANAVYNVLIEHAGAATDADDHAAFIFDQTRKFLSEYRCLPALGHGGKFYRGTGQRLDGSWGEMWYVATYLENEEQVPERRQMITATNTALATLQATYPDIR